MILNNLANALLLRHTKFSVTLMTFLVVKDISHQFRWETITSPTYNSQRVYLFLTPHVKKESTLRKYTRPTCQGQYCAIKKL